MADGFVPMEAAAEELVARGVTDRAESFGCWVTSRPTRSTDEHAVRVHGGATEGVGGSMVRGVREASDERELRALRDQGLLAVRVRPVHLLDALRASVGGRRVSGQDRLWFFETLAYMVGSNVPIETAMQEMAGGAPGDRLNRVCLDVRERLRAGDALSEAIVRVSADRAGKGWPMSITSRSSGAGEAQEGSRLRPRAAFDHRCGCAWSSVD